MSLLAKLISLTARQTQDADGTDELVMSRAGGSIFERMSVRKDDEFDSTRTGSCHSMIKSKLF